MNKTRAETLTDTLRRRIMRGAYILAERLVELSLAQEFGVSQNTVRDALHTLEQECWVRKIPRRGVYVYSFTSDEAAEVYALWSAIEELVLDWAMVRMTSRDRIRLREHILVAQIHVQTAHWQEAMDAFYHFHTGLLKLVRKPQTMQILTTLHNRARLLENFLFRYIPPNQEKLQARVAAYLAIVDAIDDDNIELARQALHDAIMFNTASILPLLKSIQS